MTDDTPRTRVAALDGLRGLAILGVFANHFGTFPGSQACGWLGVCLFFVLSGFLITGILLTQRDAIADSRATFRQSLAKFWIRRALRIFPLYYLVLALILAFNVPNSRADVWWLATYTHNIQVSMEGWTGIYGHFWTLCVEEQFYFFWPIAALAMPIRWMGPALWALVLSGTVWRLGCLWADTSRLPLIVPTIPCLDCLGAGALLGYSKHRGPSHANGFLRLCRGMGLLAMAAWVFAIIQPEPWICRKIPVEALFGNAAMAFFFTWVVGRMADARGGIALAILSQRVLVTIGMISYGLYVIHNFTRLLWPFVPEMIPSAGKIPPEIGCVTLSFLLAAGSWFAFEKPLLNLKDRLAPR